MKNPLTSRLWSYLLILATGIWLPVIVYAQGEELRFRSLTIQNELSASHVTCLLQDRKGFIWLGTQDGLNRYDGYDFNVYRYAPSDSNSLSSSSVSSIFQDRLGFIWIGTRDSGLNKYDPSTGRFEWNRHNPDDPASLSRGSVRTVIEDRLGRIWVGTEEGLNLLDRDSGKFTRFQNDTRDPSSLSGDNVWGICRRRQGGLWIGSTGGIDLLDTDSLRFTRHEISPGDLEIAESNFPPVLYEDHQGTLWIGTSSGLHRFNPATGHIATFINVADNPHSLSGNYITALFEDSGGHLWIGTRDGLNRFDRTAASFVRYFNVPDNPHSLVSSKITSIHEDRSGILWVGTSQGVSLANMNAKRFAHFSTSNWGAEGSLSDNQIWCILEDRSGMLWIGTNRGLNRYDRARNRVIHYLNEPDDPGSLSHDIVMCILETRSGALWFGTRGGGLNRYDPTRDRFNHYRHDPGDPGSLSSDFIYCLHEDESGLLWIGTGSGLNRWDPATNRATRYIHDPTNPGSLSNNDVWAVHGDRLGMIWIGTWGGGLNRCDPSTGTFTHYPCEPGIGGTTRITNILSIYSDLSGRLWIGALDGLGLLDPATGRWTLYSRNEGLPNEVVYEIQEDNDGNLWLSTNAGLAKFDPENRVFKSYDMDDGLQSNEFNRGASHRGSSGEMFFGGINGVSAFHPEEIVEDPYVPPVVITAFSIFNVSVPVGEGPGGRRILEKSISETELIRLSHRDDVISFEFAALHYAAAEKNEYAYMMEGVDRDWNYVGSRRFATYTKLPPRDYTFRVKASNLDGVWNEEGVSLKIIVTPPFWQRWWFRLIVLILLLTLIAVTYQIRTRAIKTANIQLEKRVKERTAELGNANRQLKEEIVIRKKAEEELHAQIEERLRLEAQIQRVQKLESLGVLAGGIAHDFNNLLTVVIGNASLALSRIPPESPFRKQIKAIEASAQKAADLSRQMLTYSGKGGFIVEPIDISSAVQEMAHLIEASVSKNAVLKYDLASDLPTVDADASQIGQVILNLVTNATESIGENRGTITVSTGAMDCDRANLSQTYLYEDLSEGRYVFLEVSDTGCGMDAETQSKIFDPFFSTKFTGRGLGLAAVLGIVRGHKGAINVYSEPDKGSTFKILFPTSERRAIPASDRDQYDNAAHER